MKVRQEIKMKIVQTAGRWEPGLVVTARDRQTRKPVSFQEELDSGSREEKNQGCFPLFWL